MIKNSLFASKYRQNVVFLAVKIRGIMSFNKVLLIGNTGKEPEVRHLESGVAVATFTLATTERYKDRNGVFQDQTEWHNIVCWRNLAELSEKYIGKGTQIFVEGKIRTRSWTDQNGQKRFTTEIVADNIRLLGRKSDNPSGSGYAGGAYQQSAQTYQQAGQQSAIPEQAVSQHVTDQQVADFPTEDTSDDLPF